MQANSLMHEREISGRSFELCSQNFGRRLSLGSRLLSASSLERSDKDFKGQRYARAGSPERHDADMMTGGNKLKWKESISGLERNDKNK